MSGGGASGRRAGAGGAAGSQRPGPAPQPPDPGLEATELASQCTVENPPQTYQNLFLVRALKIGRWAAGRVG